MEPLRRGVLRLLKFNVYPKKPKDPKKEEEVSLLGLGTEQDKKKGSGKKDCSHCGAKGHKRADCTKLKAALK
eukprot:scaffold35359_cov33-Cyclotella_meneghiniana.AAC.1